MTDIIALDIETTGLDPRQDNIIEIGAVRFNARRVVDEYHTLINPRCGIPQFITQLTGISNSMVQASPYIEDILGEFESFVGDLPVLGHNVKFDISFFKPYHLLEYNQWIDTYAMASVLLPGARRYNLGALRQLLSVIAPATHRALDDAKATMGVFEKLYQKGLELPIDSLADIVRLGEEVDWGGHYIFRKLLGERSKETIGSIKAGSMDYAGPLFGEPEILIRPLDSGLVEWEPLDEEETSAYLEYSGKFTTIFPEFEHRPEQVEMVRRVTEALSRGQHLLAEAGTGTGKSMAYLVPASLFALENNTRVVISTNTINLQDQLINKDIPDVKKAIDLPLNAAVLKGRRNYLCLRRFDAMKRRAPDSPQEMRILGKIIVWMLDSKNGDISEINLTGPDERAVWSRLSADDEGCTAETCKRRMSGQCPFFKAKIAAENAHILIVNHALLLADVATGNRVLPDYDFLIVDEAHHLESATTNALSFRVSQRDVDRILRELGGPKAGLIGRIIAVTKDLLTPGKLASFNILLEEASANIFQFQNYLVQFFAAVQEFMIDLREGKPLGTYPYQVRINPAERTLPGWMQVETTWETASSIAETMLERLQQSGQALAEILEENPDFEDLFSSFSSVSRQLVELRENVEALVFTPAEEMIYWTEINPQYQRLTLHAAPLHIGHLMERFIWHEKNAVILTSATLTTAGSFDYLRARLNAADADEILLGSPFDFETAACIYVPDNIPEPNDRRGHQRTIEQTVVSVAKATRGKMLVLFTSYSQLQATSRAIKDVLYDDNIEIFEQGKGASPHMLLNAFKTSEAAVLLGTRAFWEGVDVPGEALSVLVIVKLPFDVPSDPIIAARSETFEQPFYQYSIPEAILRFRQGFGRLIRTKSDRGIVIVLDKRLTSKQYGKAFIDSLPTCTIEHGNIQNAAGTAVDWLGL